MIRSVLIADDDALSRDFLEEFLATFGIEVCVADDANSAFRTLAERDVDLVITDLRMPGDDGLTLLRRIRKSGRDVPVVVVTAYGSVTTAVSALKEGALDFLTKPITPEQVEAVLARVSEVGEDGAEVSERPCHASGSDTGLVGSTRVMRDLLDTAIRVARSRATVLITGESGTGKELFARLVHEESPRRDRTYVKVNCAALAESLLESELFGHEKGAFTGAHQRRAGRFEIANGGTIFLDEIGETTPALQAKLLRVLEVREFERVGGTETLSTDVRVVAATNRDLEEEIKKGRFREDLFYRLQVVNLRVPPLRERREDVSALARHFLTHYAQENGIGSPELSDGALRLLMAHDWPGNVRELENTIERVVVMDPGATVLPEHLNLAGGAEDLHKPDVSAHVGRSLEEMEQAMILRTLESTGNSRKEAARILGVTARTLTNKITKYRELGIEIGSPQRLKAAVEEGTNA